MNFSDWIFSKQAESSMEQVREWTNSGKDDIQVLKQLRKSLAPVQAAQLLELHQLRIRARKKFERADKLFLTKQQLEQATSEIVATYKARRFARSESVADLCCGIGGDAIALGASAGLVIVDSDDVVLKMASKNLAAYGVAASQHLGPAETFSVEDFSAFHIDPDRRTIAGKKDTVARNVVAENFSPNREQLAILQNKNPNFGIKVAPATDIWQGEHEIEFIGHLRECKQQMVWSGELATKNGLTATVISNQGDAVESFRGDKHSPSAVTFASSTKRYVYDPHSALMASKLVEEYAHQHSMELLCDQSKYLTADHQMDSLLASCFEVVDLLKPNVKIIEKYLVEHNVGIVDVKRRGALDSVHHQLAKLKLRGSNSLTIVLTNTPLGFRAIACRRTNEA